MNIAVCTLFEGEYHAGAAALANSLVASGFRGTILAGFRGALPPWAGIVDNTMERMIADEVRVVFVRLETAEHLTNFKPVFLKRVLDGLAPDADAVVYFDPDVVVKCRWDSVFPYWLDGGVALVEDVNASMPARHPQRLAWLRWLESQKWSRVGAARRDLERYYNAGFVGVPRARVGFLDVWREILELSRNAEGMDARRLKNGDATSLFHSADQDALNLALMLDVMTVINAAGQDAMDFAPGGHHLSHAAGSPKPWQIGHFARALRGYSPSPAVKNFFRYADGPIKIFPRAQIWRRRFAIGCAAFIGRFYRRS